jgi:hypothetical protein
MSSAAMRHRATVPSRPCAPGCGASTGVSQIDPAEKARADFDRSVVGITAAEYATALAVAAARAT